MDITRFDLPAGPDGKEQWADIHRRPTHGQIKQIERYTRKAMAADQALDAEDGLILTLVSDWHVFDEKGQEIIGSPKAGTLDSIPQDTLSLLLDELQVVMDTTRPNAQGRS